jgi:ABC-type phosphate transport system auxiliary subunit
MKEKKGIEIKLNEESQEKMKDAESKTRLQKFIEQLEKLQEQYSVKIYSVNQVQENGEVIPMTKIIDVLNKKL